MAVCAVGRIFIFVGGLAVMLARGRVPVVCSSQAMLCLFIVGVSSQLGFPSLPQDHGQPDSWEKIACSSLCFDHPPPTHPNPPPSVLICLSLVQSNHMLLHTFAAASCRLQWQRCAAGRSAAPLTLLRDSVAVLTLMGAVERREGRMLFMSSPRQGFTAFKPPSVFPPRHSMCCEANFGVVASWSQTLFTNREVYWLFLVYMSTSTHRERELLDRLGPHRAACDLWRLP